MAKRKQAEIKDYFGVCPTCHKAEGFINVGWRDHWLFCKEHKVKWCIGANLFSSCKTESAASKRAMYKKLDFGSYREVVPFDPNEKLWAKERKKNAALVAKLNKKNMKSGVKVKEASFVEAPFEEGIPF